MSSSSPASSNSNKKKTTINEYIEQEIQLLEQYLKEGKTPDGSYYIKLRVQADALATMWQNYDDQIGKDPKSQIAGVQLFNRCAKAVNEAHEQMKSVKEDFYFMSPTFKQNYAEEIVLWEQIEAKRRLKNKELEKTLMK